MDENIIVDLKDIHKTYEAGKESVKAVRGITLKIEKGKFSSFVGPSGCGKTTTLNLIGCIDAPTEGDIRIHGKEILSMRDSVLTDFRGRSIGFIFQNFNLIPVLNVAENVSYPLKLQKVPKAEIKRRTEDILEFVGMSDRAKHRPNELSGGQRQRVAIARALIIEPALVIADEPTANLDSKTSGRIMDLMKELQQRLRTTFVFATHDPRYFDYLDQIFEMEDGLIINEKNKESV